MPLLYCSDFLVQSGSTLRRCPDFFNNWTSLNMIYHNNGSTVLWDACEVNVRFTQLLLAASASITYFISLTTKPALKVGLAMRKPNCWSHKPYTSSALMSNLLEITYCSILPIVSKKQHWFLWRTRSFISFRRSSCVSITENRYTSYVSNNSINLAWIINLR